VEWVQTTGRTIDEAKEQALDQLGVDETEAEFEVLVEASSSLFGLRRVEARVRARVRPQQAQAKTERRNRGGRRRDTTKAKPSSGRKGQSAGRQKGRETASSAGRDKSSPVTPTPAKAERSTPVPANSGVPKDGSGGDRSKGSDRIEETETMTEQESLTVETQVEIVEDFVAGLGEAFGFDVEVSSETLDDDFVEVQIEGDDLGLMIGPKGATLQAIQELSRTVAQRQSEGPLQGRVRLDVSGYRQRRREALGRFATEVAGQVVDTGERRVLEPMGAADRKVVHDTVNDIDGVRTISEGEEPRRRVVLMVDE